MRLMIGIAILTVVGSGFGGGNDASFAGRARAVPAEYSVVGVNVLESDPPDIELTLSKNMPAAGWALRVDDVTNEASTGTVEVRLSEIPPTGMAAQVITPVRIRVGLGPLLPGRHVVTLRTRRGDDAEYRLAQAFVLSAVP